MPPANKILGGENYTFDRGPDPFNLREVRVNGTDRVFGHETSDDSEIQEVTETIEDAAGEGQYLSDYDDDVSDSLTERGRRTQKAMRERQKERQTGVSLSSQPALTILIGTGIAIGGYKLLKGD